MEAGVLWKSRRLECDKARMEAWCLGRQCARSQNEGIADAQEAGITWIQNAVAAGEAKGDAAWEARGDADAVAANTVWPAEAGAGTDWPDANDADAYELAEATREGGGKTTGKAAARHAGENHLARRRGLHARA